MTQSSIHHTLSTYRAPLCMKDPSNTNTNTVVRVSITVYDNDVLYSYVHRGCYVDTAPLDEWAYHCE